MARSTDSDALDKFRFLVSWPVGDSLVTDSKASTRAGFSSCQAPKRSTTKISYREGIDTDIQFNSAGISTMQDIVLSRGVTSGASDFYDWAKNVHDGDAQKGKPGEGYTTGASKTARAAYRRDVTIQMVSRNGTVKKTWTLYNAFPVEYVAGSDLDASSDDAKSIASLTLSYDDFVES